MAETKENTPLDPRVEGTLLTWHGDGTYSLHQNLKDTAASLSTHPYGHIAGNRITVFITLSLDGMEELARSIQETVRRERERLVNG